MRFFPSAARRRAVAAGVVAVLALGGLAAPLALADDDLDDRHDQVQREIRKKQRHLEHTSKQARRSQAQLKAARTRLDSARGELADVRRRLAAAKRRDKQAQRRLQRTEQRLDTAREQLADGREALTGQRETVADSVVSTYEQGDPRLLSVSSFLEADTPEEFVTARTGHEIIADRQDDIYRDLEDVEQRLEERKDQVREVKQEAATQRREAGRRLDTVRQLTREAKQARVRMWKRVKQSRAAQRAAARARAQDHKALQRLRKREQQIKQRILRLRGGGNYTGPIDGYLTRPVPGPITSEYGYRRHPIYGYRSFHNGIDFGSPCGTPARAGSGGKIIARYSSSVYGNRVFLSIGRVNGANITLVYNHLRSYGVGQGQGVARGQSVGQVGTTGWSTGCHLHFTVLRNGNPVPPGPYL